MRDKRIVSFFFTANVKQNCFTYFIMSILGHDLLLVILGQITNVGLLRIHSSVGIGPIVVASKDRTRSRHEEGGQTFVTNLFRWGLGGLEISESFVTGRDRIEPNLA